MEVLVSNCNNCPLLKSDDFDSSSYCGAVNGVGEYELKYQGDAPERCPLRNNPLIIRLG